MVEAGIGRRFLAITIDWLMCVFIANLAGFEAKALSILLLFFVEVSILTALQQASAGQRIMRLNVVEFNTGAYLEVKRVLIRTLLICLVLPAVFTREQRGLHDWATNSVVIRN
jgi:uncharacterized RDD family membrane protein YckC